MIFVTASFPTLHRLQSPYVGRFFTPRMPAGNLKGTIEIGMPWAADNDGFFGFKPRPFVTMLNRMEPHIVRCLEADQETGCRFVACPDKYADAEGTFRMFRIWAPVIRDCGLPVAIVAQDGMTPDSIPWEDVDAVFIGGTTEFKEGEQARLIVEKGNELEKWTHMGRVNSHRRLRLAKSWGAKSVDGSSYGRFVDQKLKPALALIASF